MPLLNFHSCRLEDPDQFDRFATKTCAEKHEKKCINHVYGIFEEGGSKLQALRYDKHVWTEHDAAAHCQTREGIFEPAPETEDRAMKFMAFSHNHTMDEDEPDWGEVDKTKLPRVAHADMGDADTKTTWKYPHHWVKGGTKTDDQGCWKNGTMYLHRGGLGSAWSAANGGRGGKKASQDVLDHLDAHREAIDMGEEHVDTVGKSGLLLSPRNARHAEAVSAHWRKPLDRPDWYKIEAQSDAEAEIMIYDVIGWPFIEAKQFIQDLATLKAKTVTIRINSPGGDVFDTMAIFNAIQSHPAKIITRVESLAASAASFLAVAGKERQAYKNAMLMIHEPWVLAIGSQYDLREVADVLAKISENMVDVYAANSDVGKRELRDMLKAETWMTAKEAKDKGFLDTIVDGKAVKAEFDLSVFAHVPDSLAPAARRAPTARDAERILRDAGFSRSEAKALLAGRQQDPETDPLLAGRQLGAGAEELEEIAAALKETLVIIGG